MRLFKPPEAEAIQAMSHNDTLYEYVLNEIAFEVLPYLTQHGNKGTVEWTMDRHHHNHDEISPATIHSCRCCQARKKEDYTPQSCQLCATAWIMSASSPNMRNMVFVHGRGQVRWWVEFTAAEKQERRQRRANKKGYKPQRNKGGYKQHGHKGGDEPPGWSAASWGEDSSAGGKGPLLQVWQEKYPAPVPQQATQAPVAPTIEAQEEPMADFHSMRRTKLRKFPPREPNNKYYTGYKPHEGQGEQPARASTWQPSRASTWPLKKARIEAAQAPYGQFGAASDPYGQFGAASDPFASDDDDKDKNKGYAPRVRNHLRSDLSWMRTFRNQNKHSWWWRLACSSSPLWPIRRSSRPFRFGRRRQG